MGVPLCILKVSVSGTSWKLGRHFGDHKPFLCCCSLQNFIFLQGNYCTVQNQEML